MKNPPTRAVRPDGWSDSDEPHECIHLSVHYRLGGWKGTGESSHHNPHWVAEVNRIAPLIGLPGLHAGMNKVKRVGGRVKRATDGNIPFAFVAGFPDRIRLLSRLLAVALRLTGAAPASRRLNQST